MSREYDHDEFLHLIEDFTLDQAQLIGRWFERGDGAAFYANEDFGHPGFGDIKVFSYGSPDAQFEVEAPPQRLPDIGADINWRYQLAGTYTGD